MTPSVFTASWVIPGDGPPVCGGAIVVAGGRVVTAGSARQIEREWSTATRVDFEGCALVPALVNGHAHLELTELPRLRAGLDFPGWVRELVEEKHRSQPAAYPVGVASGSERCLRAGQGVIADVLSHPEAGAAYPAVGPRVCVFPEVLAASPAAVPRALERALSGVPGPVAAVHGLSPHAPYTTCAAAYLACAEHLRVTGGMLMSHVAESAEEVEFCETGTSALSRRLYRDLPFDPPPAPGCHPVDWLEHLGVLGPDTVLIHAVHLRPGQETLLARRGSAVVLCPRSNRNLGVGTAPGRALLDAGVTVGLGTDSALSGGDLDLWKDVAAACDAYGWSPAEALRAATAGSARALGVTGDAGSLTPRRRADFAVVALGAGRDPWDRLLGGGAVREVWLEGIRV